MDEQTQRFIEKMGLLGEADGMPRIAGRIFALLFITSAPMSLEEIATRLEVSRASVSTDARRLAQMGLLERVSRPGDRRDYYRLAPDGIRHSLESRIRTMRRFHDLLDEARQLQTADPVVERRLVDWDDAHRLLVDVYTDVVSKLDSMKGRK